MREAIGFIEDRVHGGISLQFVRSIRFPIGENWEDPAPNRPYQSRHGVKARDSSGVDDSESANHEGQRVLLAEDDKDAGDDADQNRRPGTDLGAAKGAHRNAASQTRFLHLEDVEMTKAINEF